MAVVLITAGVTGLGRRIAERFVAGGDQVVVTSRSHASGPVGADLYVLQANPADPEDAARLVERVVSRWHRLDVLINNAGPYIYARQSVADTSEAAWTAMIEGNVTGPFRMMRAALPVMRAQGGGRIVNVGSSGAAEARGWAGHGAYAAAKAGLASLTRTIADEERHVGIAAMMACPSDIKPDAKERSLDAVAAPGDPRRPAVGDDFARVVWFLAQPESAYLTGQVITMAWPFRPQPAARFGFSLGAAVWVAAWEAEGTIQERCLEDEAEWYWVTAGSRGGWLPVEALEARAST